MPRSSSKKESGRETINSNIYGISASIKFINLPIINSQPMPEKNKISYGELRAALQMTGETIRKRDIALGGRITNVYPGQNIQKAVDKVHKYGGGVVFLKNGTHVVNYDINLYSNIYLQGQNGESAIIDFNSEAYSIKAVGSGAYVTGTLSVTNNSQTVTGVGTTWISTMIGQRILLDGLWYVISAVGSTTSLTISAPYGGTTLSGTSYTIATVIEDIKISDLVVKNSASSALKFQYANECWVRDINVQTSVIGIDIDDSSQFAFYQVDTTACYYGWTINNTHYIECVGSGVLDSLVGSALAIDNVSYASFMSCFFLNSAGDGLNISNSKIISIHSSTFIENAGQGIEFVSGNTSIYIMQCSVQSNGSDGIKLTATTDNCLFLGVLLKDNGGYGLNVAAATCDDNVLSACNLTGNTSGSVSDSGTGTVIRGNVGVDDTSTSGSANIVRQFTAIEAITAKDAVYLIELTPDTHSLDLELSSAQYAYINDTASLSITGDMTIECWVKVESAPSGANATILSKYAYTGNQRSWYLSYLNGGGTIRFSVDDAGDNPSYADIVYTLTPGTWYHLAVAYDASAGSAVLYVNGSSVGTFTGLDISIFNSTAKFCIGSISEGESFFDGLIDEVRVWNDIRTAQEILNNYNKEILGSEANLQGYWQLDNDYLDKTANANNLTAVNAPVFSVDVPFVSTGTSIGKTNASVTGKYETFIGFASKNISALASGDVIVAGEVNGLSGLTPGSQYYLSNTPGSISTVPGTNTRKIGIASSTTTLLITNIW
ncbi:MAG: right-handed parallel beta-helix repeat-containing protein [Gammaproteobacteria bacterium]|nr:right-handed parallel beta-helix repeat-containing protein [Gammaproteobacteria bacterium]